MTLLNIAWLLIAVMILVAIANAYFHKYDRVFSNAFNITFSYVPTLWLTYKHKINRAAWYCVGSLYITILLAFFLRLATGHETDLDLHITGLCIMSLILLDGKASLLMALLTAFTYFSCRVLLIYYIPTPFEIGHFVDGTTVFSLIIYFGYIVRKTALKMQREISEQNSKLINANTLKDKLFGIIGHDLRSPIASLKTQLMGIHEGYINPLDFQQRTGRLMQMVDGVYLTLDNLLHWSMLQRDHLLTRPTKLDLTQLIESVLYLYTGELKEKNLSLTTCFQAAPVVADELQLQIVLRNLLHNAIKFTPAGGSIHVSTGQHDHTAWLRITDSGVGMPISRPTSLSEQVVPSRGTAGEKGTGLGLELCREFMRLNQGELLIDSEPGKGTTVTIRLSNFADAMDKQLFYQ